MNRKYLSAALTESILTLGYVKPQSHNKILAFIVESEVNGVSDAALAYRKSGTQLEREEKKRIGLRANTLMSREAFGDLTEKGLASALFAHEITIRRAVFAASKKSEILQMKKDGYKKVELIFGSSECPGCARLDGKHVSIDDISVTGPHDCIRGACSFSMSPDLDSIVERPRKQPAKSRSPSSVGAISKIMKSIFKK